MADRPVLPKDAMKAVSLFSGIGGFDLGLERAGIETVLQVELDPFCRRVLEKHWPDVRRIADVRDVTAADCEGADLIYGGFPCQPVSVAGLRKAQDDERWLWPEFARLVRVVRPRYVLVENVPGLFSAGMGDVIGDLAALGYDAQWTVVPAAAFGAPHLRERVFIAAYPARVGCESRAFFDARDGLPHYEGWHAAEGVQGWEGWQRWLNAADEAGFAAHADRQGRAHAAGCAGSPEPYWWPLSVADVPGLRLERGLPQPVVSRMDDGLSRGVDSDRSRALGNAVVPQVAEYVGRRLVEFDRALAGDPLKPTTLTTCIGTDQQRPNVAAAPPVGDA